MGDEFVPGSMGNESVPESESRFVWVIRAFALAVVVWSVYGVSIESYKLLSDDPSEVPVPSLGDNWIGNYLGHQNTISQEALQIASSRIFPEVINAVESLSTSNSSTGSAQAFSDLSKLLTQERLLLKEAAEAHQELLQQADERIQQRREDDRKEYELVFKEVVVQPVTRLLFALLALAGINVGGQALNNWLQVRALRTEAKIEPIQPFRGLL